MTRPILNYLTEFQPVPRPADVARWEASAAAEDAALLEAERIQALVDAARGEGVEEGRRRVEDTAEARCRALAEHHAAALAAARADWSAQEGQALADGLREGLAAVEATLAEGLAAALSPFIAPALRSRTVADLGRALADLMAGHHGALIAIKGPADVLDALRVRFGDSPVLSLAATEGTEVVVEAGDTTIRSQMQAWSDRFQAAFQVPPMSAEVQQ